MHRSIPAVALLSALTLPLVAASPLPTVDELVIDRIDWSGEAEAGGALIVTNPFGDVRLRGAKDRILHVHAAAQRLDSAGERLGVDVVRRGDRIFVTVAYPASDGTTADRIAERERLDRVDLALHVPADLDVSVHTVDGLIDAKKVANDVSAATRGGYVKIATKRSARVRSGSGDVSLMLLEPGWARPAAVESASGAVTIELPPEADLDLDVAAGGALAPLPFAEGRFTAAAPEADGSGGARGRVGTGGPGLWVRSGSGDVELRTAPRLHRVERVAPDDE